MPCSVTSLRAELVCVFPSISFSQTGAETEPRVLVIAPLPPLFFLLLLFLSFYSDKAFAVDCVTVFETVIQLLTCDHVVS